MIAREEARNKAVAYIQAQQDAYTHEWMTDKEKRTHELMLDERSTREHDFGWVFFYNGRMFLEAGDDEFALYGCGALIVDRNTGEVHETGTAFPVEHYIAIYRRDGNLDRAHDR